MGVVGYERTERRARKLSATGHQGLYHGLVHHKLMSRFSSIEAHQIVHAAIQTNLLARFLTPGQTLIFAALHRHCVTMSGCS